MCIYCIYNKNVCSTEGPVSKSFQLLSDDAAAVQTMELQEEKEDWFSQLSGGQKSKVELVRTVFLRKECPSVLLGK